MRRADQSKNISNSYARPMSAMAWAVAHRLSFSALRADGSKRHVDVREALVDGRPCLTAVAGQGSYLVGAVFQLLRKKVNKGQGLP